MTIEPHPHELWGVAYCRYDVGHPFGTHHAHDGFSFFVELHEAGERDRDVLYIDWDDVAERNGTGGALATDWYRYTRVP